jgi:hypothetical protein
MNSLMLNRPLLELVLGKPEEKSKVHLEMRIATRAQRGAQQACCTEENITLSTYDL